MGTITSNRRILVIGSQCASLPPPLSFLPQAAVDLHAVMTDPEVGGCTDATPRGLLIDPTVAEATAAINAASGRRPLRRPRCSWPSSGTARKPNATSTSCRTTVPSPRLRHRHPSRPAHQGAAWDASGLDGLVVLIDTCSSGVGALEAAAKWVRELEGACASRC